MSSNDECKNLSLRIGGMDIDISDAFNCELTSEEDEMLNFLVSKHDVRDIHTDLLNRQLRELVNMRECEEEERRADAALDSLLNKKDSRAAPTLQIIRNGRVGEAEKLAKRFSFIMSNMNSEDLSKFIAIEELMAQEVRSVIRSREMELERLRQQAEQTVQETLRSADPQPHHFNRINEKMRQLHWAYRNQLEELGEWQRQQFRQIIDVCYESGQLPLLDHSSTGLMKSRISSNADDSTSSTPTFSTESLPGENCKLGESFTIYLGAQLKTMHNMRLLSSPSLAALAAPLDSADSVSSRLHSALALYGRNLTGLVLLVDRHPMAHIEGSSEFARMCEQSTELHFSSLTAQLQEVGECARKASTARSRRSHSPSPSAERGNGRSGDEGLLNLGDVYCTRHSNLGNVHVVFHVVVDRKLETEDINSRHECLAALRNILRLCSRFGVHSISIPLLLIERANEQTTSAWCQRRAELVFKCVKGYLIEVCGSGWSSASVGGASISNAPHYNVNFVLPVGLSLATYSQIVSFFPSLFHLVPSVTA